MQKQDNYSYGIQKEEELKNRIEEAIGEPITKFEPRYASKDYRSNSWLIELKSRRRLDRNGQPFLPSSKDTWLMPSCKTKGLKASDNLVFLYHFEADDSLWYCVFDPEEFKSYYTDCPSWHPTRQEHIYIPREAWTLIPKN